MAAAETDYWKKREKRTPLMAGQSRALPEGHRCLVGAKTELLSGTFGRAGGGRSGGSGRGQLLLLLHFFDKLGKASCVWPIAFSTAGHRKFEQT